ncbi:MAG: alpha/beta hydrolase [Candidatus Hodarchaeales archaeon]
MKPIEFLNIEIPPSPSVIDYLTHVGKIILNSLILFMVVILYPFLAIYQSFWPRSIDKTVKPYAKEFYWHPGGKPKRGVLFIHGFAANPAIFKEYAKIFFKEGYITYGARIEGHGTSPAHFASTNCVDWYMSIRKKYFEIQKEVEDVLIIAHSMGTLLAIILASLYPIHSLVLLSSPVKVRPKPLYRVHFLLRFASKFVKYWPHPSSYLKRLESSGIRIYHKNPLEAVAGLFDVMEVARDRLEYIKCPVLAMLGDKDEHVELSTLEYLKEKLGDKLVETWVAPDASHVITETSEIEIFKQKIRNFVMDHSPPF